MLWTPVAEPREGVDSYIHMDRQLTRDLCVLSRSSRINKSSQRSSNTWAHGMSSENCLRERMWDIRLWRSPPTETFIIYNDSSSPSADDPPSISSARQVPPSVFIIHHDTSAFGPFASVRQVTWSAADYPIETYL